MSTGLGDFWDNWAKESEAEEKRHKEWLKSVQQQAAKRQEEFDNDDQRKSGSVQESV